MGYEFEKKRERFSEHEIPDDVREYFDSFSGDEAWNRESIEHMKRRDIHFSSQLWGGLLGLLDRLIETRNRDLDVSKKLVTIRDAVVPMLNKHTDDIAAATELRRYITDAGVGVESLKMSDILKYAYVDEARAIQDNMQDPDAMRPFDYGRENAPHLSPLYDPRLPGWANEALAEVDRFDIVPDAREEIHAPTPQEKEQIQKGDKILGDILGEIERGENKDW